MYCKELNKEFESKSEMFAELKANKDLLVKQKKSEVKCKRMELAVTELNPANITKAENQTSTKIYPVISTTNYMDSHNDVHLNGSMTKTATEQNGKVYYVADHELRVNSIIAQPKNVNMYLEKVGDNEYLMFEVDKTKIMHRKALELIEDKAPLQNSIRMQYVKIDLAVNDAEMEEEYKAWTEVYPKILNKERADEKGYFWAVRELKIVNEGSLVLFGSNDQTPVKDSEAVVNDTSKDEPLQDTQITVTQMLQKIKFN